jgi:hypothetical protein
MKLTTIGLFLVIALVAIWISNNTPVGNLTK